MSKPGSGSIPRTRWRRRAPPTAPVGRGCSPGCRSGSRTSSIRSTCRPSTARRSIAATGRSPLLPPLRAALLAAPPRPIDHGVAAPRIGLCRTPAWDEAEPATHRLIESTAAQLSAAGAVVREVSFAPQFATILEHHRRIFSFEAARNYAYEYEQHHEQVSQVLRDTLLTPGRELPLAAYVEAIETAEAFRRHLDDIFRDVDVLLTPSAAGEAPLGLGSTGDPSFNSIWTLAWTPCVTLPAGHGPSGLPLGIQ